MQNEQTFFVDFYGYKNYNGHELTDFYINEGEYLDCDGTFGKDGLKKYVENYEKEGTLITEFFVKLRVMKGTPLFEHIAKGGKVKLEMI